MLQALPQVQETLVSLSVDILPLAWDIMVLVMEVGCWRLGLDEPRGRFRLEPEEEDSGELFPCLLYFSTIKRNVVLFLRPTLFMHQMLLLWFMYEWLFWCITNHLLIWYKVNFTTMLYLYAAMCIRTLARTTQTKDIRVCSSWHSLFI